MVDLAGFRVVVERPCEVCDGGGFVEADHDLDPPRECGSCDGTGQETDTIGLDELADWVVARVPSALIPGPELEKVVASLQKTITAAAERSQGLADPDSAGSYLRVVQEGAEALRAVTELIVESRHG